MPAASIEFTSALCDAIGTVVPDGVTLVSEPGGVRLDVGDGGGRNVHCEPDDPTEAFVLAVLEALQVEIIEFVTHTGWPPADPSRPDAPQRGGELPAPGAEVVEAHLRCWFGEHGRPALRIPPVPLDAGRRP